MSKSDLVEKELEKEGEYLSITKGFSMMPLLRQNRDQVVIEKIKRPLKRFDVVLYNINDTYVLHRIIKIKKDYYVIYGDNRVCEERIPKELIIGVMKGFYRDDKYYDNKSIIYRLYVNLWTRPYRLRIFLIRIIRRLKKKVNHE